MPDSQNNQQRTKAENIELSTTINRKSAAISCADLATTSFAEIALGPSLPPLLRGEILLEEFMRPAGLTARGLAAELGIPGNRISTIIHGTRGITAETVLLLAHRFGTSAELWINLQTAYDLAIVRARTVNTTN
jgi:addiction module HigA family antidote